MALNEHNPGASGGVERDPLLDRAYRGAATEEPPARLDAAILAAARREAGARPRPLGAALHAWRIPMSIAAVVVLSVSLVTLIGEEGGVSIEPSPPPAVAPPVAQSRPAAELDSRKQLMKEQVSGSARAPSAPLPAPATPRQDAPVALSKSEPAAAPEARRERAASASGRLAVEEQQPVWRGYEQEPPWRWLERIEELRRLGQRTEAESMLAEFRRRFPGHPLPPGLR